MQKVIDGHQEAIDTLAGVVPGGSYMAKGGSAQGLRSMDASRDDLGEDQELLAAFTGFNSDWIYGLGSLLKTGEGIVEQLTEAMRSYQGQESAVTDLLQDAWLALWSPDHTKSGETMSWSEVDREVQPDWGGWDQIDDDIGDSMGSIGDDVGGVVDGATDVWNSVTGGGR
ncbi:hypothetical protein [Parasphingorhabdus pacifica]